MRPGYGAIGGGYWPPGRAGWCDGRMDNENLCIVVGYDGSDPAVRALDAAAALLSGRSGSLHLVYVCQTSPADMMSAQALAVTDDAFDQIARDLHEQAGKQLADSGEDRWRFERRSGIAADVLAGVARTLRDARPEGEVALAVGRSSRSAHRVLGSAAVSLARHAQVPVLIVP